MAQPDVTASEPPSFPRPLTPGFFRKLFGRQIGSHSTPTSPVQSSHAERPNGSHDIEKDGLIRRMSRKVVPGLPRAQTFKRQQSEQRTKLAPVEPTPDERRAVSVDRRSRGPRASSASQHHTDPRISAPGLLGSPQDDIPSHAAPIESLPETPTPTEPVAVEETLEHVTDKEDEVPFVDECPVQDKDNTDTRSVSSSQYYAMIHDELEKTWILNLSMHFRDRSKREKFFVTYREQEHLWRRVTISLDYRNAPPNSLEFDLIHTHYQRDKSAKIYEAIRESLRDIQFYDTVTNLKLQTTEGRLHVHVVEDGNEIIQYPTVSQIKHLGCRRVREKDIVFDSHMSGFVYKVHVNGQTLIKKEIPSPDTVDEFLYEVNALNRLHNSGNVIEFHGVVVDDQNEHVKGLLISFAEQGALIDIIYENCKDHEFDIPWSTREKWARQIVQGLSDIHESGFVQGDFTLSNIVIDGNDDAKIIDINRRGCPVGWEPPEATPLIECNQRISMYIGVKSDLYQLGMVLWALAMQEDEPEAQGRPLILGPEVNIPDWYRQMAEICLSDDPRMRLQASSLLTMFPTPSRHADRGKLNPPAMSLDDDDYVLKQYLVDDYPAMEPDIRTVEQPSDWSYVSRPYAEPSPVGYEPPYYYTRGRSPPSPLPSNYDRCASPRQMYNVAAWAANRDIPSSYSDIGPDDRSFDDTPLADKDPFVPRSIIDSETTSDERPEGQLLGFEAKHVDGNATGKASEFDGNQGAVQSFPEPILADEGKIVDQLEMDRSMEVHTVTSMAAKPVEVIGEELASLAKQTAPGLTDANNDDTSMKADSACDVVMPSDETLREVTQAKGEVLFPKRKLVNESGDMKNTIDGPQDAPKADETDTMEQAPKVLAKAKREVLELHKTEAYSELSATEGQGNTAPEPHQPITEASSRTVTPSKAHECLEDKLLQTTIHRHGQPIEEGNEDEKKDRASNKTAVDKAKLPEPLIGVGAAHLTSHEDDAIRKKTTIDEYLNVVGLDLPDKVTKANAKNLTGTT